MMMRLIATRYPIELAAVIVVVVVAIGSFTNRDYHSAIKSPSIRLITFGFERYALANGALVLPSSAIQWQGRKK